MSNTHQLRQRYYQLASNDSQSETETWTQVSTTVRVSPIQLLEAGWALDNVGPGTDTTTCHNDFEVERRHGNPQAQGDDQYNEEIQR
jgi:hypothetical protein